MKILYFSIILFLCASISGFAQSESKASAGIANYLISDSLIFVQSINGDLDLYNLNFKKIQNICKNVHLIAPKDKDSIFFSCNDGKVYQLSQKNFRYNLIAELSYPLDAIYYDSTDSNVTYYVYTITNDDRTKIAEEYYVERKELYISVVFAPKKKIYKTYLHKDCFSVNSVIKPYFYNNKIYLCSQSGLIDKDLIYFDGDFHKINCGDSLILSFHDFFDYSNNKLYVIAGFDESYYCSVYNFIFEIKDSLIVQKYYSNNHGCFLTNGEKSSEITKPCSYIDYIIQNNNQFYVFSYNDVFSCDSNFTNWKFLYSCKDSLFSKGLKLIYDTNITKNFSILIPQLLKDSSIICATNKNGFVILKNNRFTFYRLEDS